MEKALISSLRFSCGVQGRCDRNRNEAIYLEHFYPCCEKFSKFVNISQHRKINFTNSNSMSVTCWNFGVVGDVIEYKGTI